MSDVHRLSVTPGMYIIELEQLFESMRITELKVDVTAGWERMMRRHSDPDTPDELLPPCSEELNVRATVTFLGLPGVFEDGLEHYSSELWKVVGASYFGHDPPAVDGTTFELVRVTT